jgi:phosphoserine phosphatase
MTELVATLIARPGNAENLSSAVGRCLEFLDNSKRVELAPDEAVDVAFIGDKPIQDLREHLQTFVADLPVDIVVQPVASRRKKLLVADMDSTVIGQECIDELADFAGLKEKVALITERAMRGEIEFEPALRERVALLKGLPASVVDRVLAERITLDPGAKLLVATMRANGARAILVSGGFTSFVDRIRTMVGFDESYANRLIETDGNLAGEVEEPILGRAAKLATLEDAIIRLDLDASETLAVGDGANDLAMLGRAGLGIAYHAKPKVAEAADARIDHNDLTALLFAQGYRRSEFAKV